MCHVLHMTQKFVLMFLYFNGKYKNTVYNSKEVVVVFFLPDI